MTDRGTGRVLRWMYQILTSRLFMAEASGFLATVLKDLSSEPSVNGIILQTPLQPGARSDDSSDTSHQRRTSTALIR